MRVATENVFYFANIVFTHFRRSELIGRRACGLNGNWRNTMDKMICEAIFEIRW